MKRILSALLALCLVLGAGAAFAAPSKDEIGGIVDALYARQRALHPFGVVPLEESEPGIREELHYASYAADPQTMMKSVEYVIAKPQRLPSGRALSNDFAKVFAAAYALTESVPEAGVLNVQRMQNEFGGGISVGTQGSEWYFDGTTEGFEVRVGPVMLTDKDRNIIEGTLYLFAVFTSDQITRLWLCADEEIVFSFLSAIDADGIRARNKEARYIHSWMEEKEAFYEAADRNLFILDDGRMDRIYGEDGTVLKRSIPEFADTTLFIPIEPEPAAYPEETMIGTVKVVNESATNLRATPDAEGPILVRVPPDTEMECYAITENGWYEVLFNGEPGFISSRVTELTPNARYFTLYGTEASMDGASILLASPAPPQTPAP